MPREKRKICSLSKDSGDEDNGLSMSSKVCGITQKLDLDGICLVQVFMDSLRFSSCLNDLLNKNNKEQGMCWILQMTGF